ncbi:MAG: phosphonate ABC transporter, permease protein PhnE [Pseudomonadota bacterium]
MSDTATAPAAITVDEAYGTIKRRRFALFGVLGAVFLYLAYAWVSFGVTDLILRSEPDRAVLLGTDSVAYKVHVFKNLRRDGLDVSIEGERRATYEREDWPDWVTPVGETDAEIDLGGGYRVVIAGPGFDFEVPDYGTISAESGEDGISWTLPDGAEAPDWASLNERKVDLRPTVFRRVQITATRIEVHRYFFGWENFWFSFDSPLRAYSFTEIMGLMVSGDRLDPEQSNFSLITGAFLNNPEWQHGHVFTALGETILMAVLGTMTAVLLGLPLAFLAARNFTPSMAVRFALRRIFDFLRGVDALIWSLILIRAFGLGPLTGALAIALTDTGTLGKLFSEALENVDNRQIEGVRATGAGQLQRYRFGVIPQIMPVFISQGLYYLESNTRSATVIGALGAGGIGLVLVETLRTSRDWENTLYIILLTVIVVVLMDQLSSWLRRRLITGE